MQTRWKPLLLYILRIVEGCNMDGGRGVEGLACSRNRYTMSCGAIRPTPTQMKYKQKLCQSTDLLESARDPNQNTFCAQIEFTSGRKCTSSS